MLSSLQMEKQMIFACMHDGVHKWASTSAIKTTD